MALRPELEVTLMIVAGLALVLALGRALTAAERRGWIRLHGVSKGSAAVAFAAAMENMFSASGSQARQLLDQQKPVGHHAPTLGDRLGDEPSAMGQSSLGAN